MLNEYAIGLSIGCMCLLSFLLRHLPVHAQFSIKLDYKYSM